MQSAEFRHGKWPVFMNGHDLAGIPATGLLAPMTCSYHGRCDGPEFRVHCTRIRIIPANRWRCGTRCFTRTACRVLSPYYKRTWRRANNFTFSPGFRSTYGPFLLNTYNWFARTQHGRKSCGLSREARRGRGADVDAHLGQWGQVGLKYYS